MKRPVKRPVKAPKWPWQLPPIEDPDIYAIQAFEQGRAGVPEQRRVWAFLQRFCGVDRMTFYPGGEDGRRASDFAEGKRWIGDQLRRLSRLTPTQISSRGEPPPMPAPAEPASSDQGDR